MSVGIMMIGGHGQWEVFRSRGGRYSGVEAGLSQLVVQLVALDGQR